jgi:hypothetical protein
MHNACGILLLLGLEVLLLRSEKKDPLTVWRYTKRRDFRPLEDNSILYVY